MMQSEERFDFDSKMKTGKQTKEDLHAELEDMEKQKIEIDILYRESREENKKHLFTED